MLVQCPVDPGSGTFLLGCVALVVAGALLIFGLRRFRSQEGSVPWPRRFIALLASAAGLLLVLVSVVLLTTGPGLIVEYPQLSPDYDPTKTLAEQYCGLVKSKGG